MTQQQREELGRELTDSILNIGRKHKAPLMYIITELLHIIIVAKKALQELTEEEKSKNN